MNVEDDLDAIDAVIYGDAFDCAVTFEEIWRYSRIPLTCEELLDRLRQPPLKTLLGERDGLYFLAGRDQLAERRSPRRARAQRLKKRARLVARFLQHAPLVRGIVLTGSVAADDAEKDADVDILVIVAEGHIALAFMLLAPLSRMLSRRVFCPNYYLSQAHLALSDRNHYIARELIQSEQLTLRSDSLVAANQWAQELLPNAAPLKPPVKHLPGGALLQRILEFPFTGTFGQRCEQRARAVVKSRLLAHHGSFQLQVPEDVLLKLDLGIELRFHGSPRVKDCIERYTRKRAECARRMSEAASCEPLAQPG